MKTAIFSPAGENSFNSAQLKMLRPLNPEFHSGAFTPSEMIRAARDCSVIALTPKTVKFLGRDILNHLPKLRGLAVYSTGVEWTDAAHIKALAITLKNVPDYCSTKVAEWVVGQVFAFSRKSEVEGKTLGIIGLGRIGSKVAAKGALLGLKVMHFDTQLKVGSLTAAAFDKVLTGADFVALTCPYQGRTLIGSREVGLMKKTAYLINSSPAELVDAEAAMNLAGCVQDHGTAGWTPETEVRGTQMWTQNIVSLHRQLFKGVTVSRPYPFQEPV